MPTAARRAKQKAAAAAGQTPTQPSTKPKTTATRSRSRKSAARSTRARPETTGTGEQDYVASGRREIERAIGVLDGATRYALMSCHGDGNARQAMQRYALEQLRTFEARVPLIANEVRSSRTMVHA